jgi:hypothetical protein
MGWWILGTYIVGAFFACRTFLLRERGDFEQRLDVWKEDRKKHGKDFYWSHENPRPTWTGFENALITVATILWPVFFLGWLGVRLARYLIAGLTFLMFPRGIRTRYSRKKEKAEATKALEENNRKLSEEIRKISTEYDLAVPEDLG